MRYPFCFVFYIALCLQSTESRQINYQDTLIDLSYPVNNQSHAWITARDIEMRTMWNGTRLFGDRLSWYQTDDMEMNVHSATHVDAPSHSALGRWSISDIPMMNMVERPVAVVDVTPQVWRDRDYMITVDDILENERQNGRLADDCVLLFKTGWSRYWFSRAYYFGTPTNDVRDMHFPGKFSCE